jgi:hypothetical protein
MSEWFINYSFSIYVYVMILNQGYGKIQIEELMLV